VSAKNAIKACICKTLQIAKVEPLQKL